MTDDDAPEEPTPPWRLTREWLAVAAFATALVVVLIATGVTTRLDNIVYDATLRQAPNLPADDVLIVAIDDRALAEVGAWPWPRSRHAEILRRIGAAAPRAVAYDVLFVEPAANPADDAELAKAVAQSGRVCVPVLIEAPGPNGAAARVSPPIGAIGRAAAGVGHVNLVFDPDGVSRRADLALAGDGLMIPHLMRCAARVGRGQWPGAAPAQPTAIQRPLRGVETVRIPFAGEPGRFRTVSAASVLRGEVPDAFVRDRFIVVGATAAGLHDTHSTPLSSRTGILTGAELQANLLEGLLHQRVIRPAPLWLAALAALLPVWTHLLALRFASPRANLIVALAAISAVLAVSAIALLAARLWIPPFPAILTLLAVFPVWGWRRLQAASDYLLEELTRFSDDGEGKPRAIGDVVGGRIATLRRAVQRTRELQAQREQAVQFISHDIRSPQTSILALLDGPEGRDAPPALADRVRRHAQRTLALTDNFVHLAKAEGGALSLEALDLSDLLDVALDDLWPVARRAGLRLERVGPLDEAWVVGDRSLLGRAIANLIDNAIKFSPASGVIEGRVELGSRIATLSIRDHGPGLSPEAQASVFERYRRAAGNAAEGVGLGLAVAAEVARRHGGAVACESTPGAGATFRITLPLDPKEAA